MPYAPGNRPSYEPYQKTEKAKKARAQSNKARRMLMREGVVHKGDGKDVDHKKPLSKGGATTRSNLRVKSKSDNRSFKRNSDGSIK
jgi:hypothetical protein